MTDGTTSQASTPSAAIPRREIEDALHTWLVACAALSDDRVWWADGEVAETQFPFATLAWLSTTVIGRDADQNVEVLIEDEDLVDDGALDVRMWAGGWRRMVVSVQVFADPKSPPETSAVARLEAAVAKLSLPTRKAALGIAGFGLVSMSPIRNVGPGQASVELTGIAASNVSEDARSIQGARFVTTDASDLTTEVIAPDGFDPPA